MVSAILCGPVYGPRVGMLSHKIIGRKTTRCPIFASCDNSATSRAIREKVGASGDRGHARFLAVGLWPCLLLLPLRVSRNSNSGTAGRQQGQSAMMRAKSFQPRGANSLGSALCQDRG